MSDVELLTKEGFRIVGLHYDGRNEQNELAELWQRFINRLGELGLDRASPGWRCYGASRPSPAGFEYLAAVAWDDDEAPEGWVIWDVPQNTYAQVAVDGVNEIHGTISWFRDEWLPHSTCRRGNGPILEIYEDTAGVLMLFPVQPQDED
jgi:AraC family transcriptional regulator